MSMTKAESEALFLDAIFNDASRSIEMSASQTNSFRVHVHRIMKEMDKKNHTLWLKAKQFGVSRVGDRTVISKAELGKFKVYKLNDDGTEELIIRDPETALEMQVDDLGPVDLNVDEEVITLKASIGDDKNCRYCANKVCSIKQKFMRECDAAGKDTLDELLLVVCSKWGAPIV